VKLSKLSKLSALAALVFSNTVLAESYQSFSTLSYSNNSYSFNTPNYNVNRKGDNDKITLFTQYYFDERLALGPLNEFDYINTSSNVYASVANSNNKSSSLNNEQSYSFDSSNNSIAVGGQWITHGFILGAGYSHEQSERAWSDTYSGVSNSGSYDNNEGDISLLLGYLFSDDFLISLGCNDEFDNTCGFTASYNWQLMGTDYIGFSYHSDSDFDIHQLSSQYFFGVGDQSYFMVGGDYTFEHDRNRFRDDYWRVNGSYYYDTNTSISAYYNEGDYYGVSASYFINQNYSIKTGYNSTANKKDDVELDGYYVSFSAQF
jgi:hypothetical protein